MTLIVIGALVSGSIAQPRTSRFAEPGALSRESKRPNGFRRSVTDWHAAMPLPVPKATLTPTAQIRWTPDVSVSTVSKLCPECVAAARFAVSRVASLPSTVT